MADFPPSDGSFPETGITQPATVVAGAQLRAGVPYSVFLISTGEVDCGGDVSNLQGGLLRGHISLNLARLLHGILALIPYPLRSK